MTNPKYEIERIEGTPVMIKLTIGTETILLDEDEAYSLGHQLILNAELSYDLDYIDTAFDGDSTS